MSEILKATHPRTIEKHVLTYIKDRLYNQVLLDIGTGSGIFGYFVRLIRPDSILIGVDVNESYVSQLKPTRIYTHHIIATAGNLPFRPVIHISILIEVIEHLVKEKGVTVIQDLKKLSKYCIITTPEKGRTSKHHKSSYTISDFTKHGYTVKKISYNYIPFSLKLLNKLRCILLGLGTGEVLICEYDS